MSATKQCPHTFETYIEDVVNKGVPFFIANIVINSLACVPAVIINALVIVAIYRKPTLRVPSNILLCSLAFTDFAVGLVVQPIYVISRIAELKGYFHPFCSTWLVSRLLASWLTNASLGTLTAISIDRVLAVHLDQRYRLVVTTKRVVAAVLLLWLLGAFLSSIRLFGNVRVFLGAGSALYAICLTVLCVSYWKTFHTIKQYKNRFVNSYQSRPQRLANLIRYKRSLNTMLFIVCLVLLCYLPYIGLSLPVVFTGRSVGERAAWTVIDTLLLLNSALNPILYYWRIRDVRSSVMEIVTNAIPGCCLRQEETAGQRHEERRQNQANDFMFGVMDIADRQHKERRQAKSFGGTDTADQRHEECRQTQTNDFLFGGMDTADQEHEERRQTQSSDSVFGRTDSADHENEERRQTQSNGFVFGRAYTAVQGHKKRRRLLRRTLTV